MKTPEISMYNSLKPSLGEEDAQVFIEAHNESIAEKIEIMKSDLATKGDMQSLKEALHAVEISLAERTGKHHVECMKGIYITGLIQLIIIIGSVLAIIRASI